MFHQVIATPKFVFYFFQKLINYLRVNSHAACYASSMSPPVAQQIITSMRIIMGEEGGNEGEFFLQDCFLCRKREMENYGILNTDFGAI